MTLNSVTRIATAALIGLALSAAAWADDLSIDELLDATDDVTRGESSQGTMTMHVKTKRYERSMSMEMWTQGQDKSLIRITAPAKERGTATLKVDNNIWNYLPKVDRTIKVPASMMSGSWMGSHFSNDDLVKENRLADEFTGNFKAKPSAHERGNYVIELVPHPDAAVVWGRIVVEVTPEKMPVTMHYYDEKGRLKRTMSFSDLREVDGRQFPGRMKMVPTDKPDEFTEMVYGELSFSDVPDSTFTLQALKQ